VSLLPDWNSIESTARWSDILFWAGIVCLVLLAVTEIASRIYASRSSDLSAAAARVDRETREAAEAKARGETAQAQREAAAANEKAAELARQAAPRHLTPAQQQLIASAIHSYRGAKISVKVPMGDQEAKSFAGDFVSLFRNAQWSIGAGDGVAQAVFSGAPVYGVQVLVNESDAKKGQIPAGADQLTRALISAGLCKHGFVSPQTTPGSIEVIVGTKEPQ
jgi:hypothetical protein